MIWWNNCLVRTVRTLSKLYSLSDRSPSMHIYIPCAFPWQQWTNKKWILSITSTLISCWLARILCRDCWATRAATALLSNHDLNPLKTAECEIAMHTVVQWCAVKGVSSPRGGSTCLWKCVNYPKTPNRKSNYWSMTSPRISNTFLVFVRSGLIAKRSTREDSGCWHHAKYLLECFAASSLFRWWNKTSA